MTTNTTIFERRVRAADNESNHRSTSSGDDDKEAAAMNEASLWIIVVLSLIGIIKISLWTVEMIHASSKTVASIEILDVPAAEAIACSSNNHIADLFLGEDNDGHFCPFDAIDQEKLYNQPQSLLGVEENDHEVQSSTTMTKLDMSILFCNNRTTESPSLEIIALQADESRMMRRRLMLSYIFGVATCCLAVVGGLLLGEEQCCSKNSIPVTFCDEERRRPRRKITTGVFWDDNTRTKPI